MKRRLAVPLVLLALCACDHGSDNDRPATTTTTVSTTTNVPPSSTTTTTTTTLLECTVLVEVVFSVTNNEILGALQYNTAYPQPGTFLGNAGWVSCSKLAGDFASFNDVDAEERLVTAMIAAAGFAGPADIATCEFCTVGAPPVPDDFVITIVDQSRPDFSPASATVAVTQVNVISGPTTTTTLGP